MFNTYEDIFSQRANSYHQAMALYPLARQQEFESAVEYLDILPNSTICDVPSGGGYLRKYVSTASCFFHFLETSENFASATPKANNVKTQLCKFEVLPLPSQSVDRLIMLAALHHIQKRHQVFKEFQRVLKPNGKILIADVEADTNTGNFLNTFVNKFNSMGHEGDFITPQLFPLFDELALDVISVNRPVLHWNFDNECSMITFCRNLFGLDKATDEDILSGIHRYLEPVFDHGKVSIRWQLVYVLLQLKDT
jgi:ubiquinone/menaquinone biosynthesis C-methylase UbiE